MILRKSERKRAKIKMALQGSAGSGKTMSALLLAKGLTSGNLENVAIIDTENGSADLYAHLGQYNVLGLEPPFTPEKYIEAVNVCEKAGMQVVIIDSISHLWEELLDYHSKLAGNSFTNWSRVTPRLNAFVQKMLHSKCHIIATMRTKQDYVLNQKDGKYVPEKVGLKAVQRDGVDYEFTLVFDIDIKHYAVASKDRTGLFKNTVDFKIGESTGKRILDWCNMGSEAVAETSQTTEMEKVSKMVSQAVSITELEQLYYTYPIYQDALHSQFSAKKKELEDLVTIQNFNHNGNAKLN